MQILSSLSALRRVAEDSFGQPVLFWLLIAPIEKLPLKRLPLNLV